MLLTTYQHATRQGQVVKWPRGPGWELHGEESAQELQETPDSVEGGSGCLLSPACPVHSPWLAFSQVSSAQWVSRPWPFLGGWSVLLFSCSLSSSQALSHAQLGPPSATASPRAVRVVWQMQCKRESLHPLFQLSTQESVLDAKWRAPLWVLEYNRK